MFVLSSPVRNRFSAQRTPTTALLVTGPRSVLVLAALAGAEGIPEDVESASMRAAIALRGARRRGACPHGARELPGHRRAGLANDLAYPLARQNPDWRRLCRRRSRPAGCMIRLLNQPEG
jgi:hypothetical protein